MHVLRGKKSIELRRAINIHGVSIFISRFRLWHLCHGRVNLFVVEAIVRFVSQAIKRDIPKVRTTHLGAEILNAFSLMFLGLALAELKLHRILNLLVNVVTRVDSLPNDNAQLRTDPPLYHVGERSKAKREGIRDESLVRAMTERFEELGIVSEELHEFVTGDVTLRLEGQHVEDVVRIVAIAGESNGLLKLPFYVIVVVKLMTRLTLGQDRRGQNVSVHMHKRYNILHAFQLLEQGDAINHRSVLIQITASCVQIDLYGHVHIARGILEEQ